MTFGTAPYSIPHDVIAGWPAFVENWCLGVEPFNTPQDIQKSLQALRDIWPEQLARIEVSSAHGLAVIAPIIHLGTVLERVAPLTGFERVLARYKSGETSALAELEFSAALVSRHLIPQLETPLNGKLIDCAVCTSGVMVFVEVISPETSDEFKRSQSNMFHIASEIIPKISSAHVDLLLEAEPSGSEQMLIERAIAAPCDGSSQQADGVRITKIALNGPPRLTSNKDPGETRPVIAVCCIETQKDLFSSARIQLPITDERANRLFGAELHHFSKDKPNTLAVKVGNIPGAMKSWANIAKRWFQPDRNRRVGAIALWGTALVGQPMAVHARWTIVKNPFAYVQVPNEFLATLSSLDEAEVFKPYGDVF